jgi:soluble lytic murein transglycosylase-like protein
VLVEETRDATVLEPYYAVPIETEPARADLDQDKTEDPVNSKPGISSTAISRKEAEQLCDSIIRKAAKRYQVDPSLIRAIIMAESSYNPKAVSKKGAMGLMQLMPRTAEALGVEDSFNPEHNINGGVRYFKQLLNQFDGDVKLALAAYNAGSGRVREYNGIPPFKATQYYIKKVFEYRKGYQK